MTESIPSTLACPSCGAPVAAGAVRCSYCAGTLVWGALAPMTPKRSVRDAAEAWARTVFGAPRKFADLVRGVEVRDEVIHRVITNVVRRDIHEERLPSNARTRSAPRVDPRTVDPFAVPIEELRAASEHFPTCVGCGGAGKSACPSCRGGGRV